MDRGTKEYIKDYLDDLLEFINWFQINYEDEELVEEFNELKLSVKFETRPANSFFTKDTDAYYDGVKEARDTLFNELRKGEQQ